MTWLFRVASQEHDFSRLLPMKQTFFRSNLLQHCPMSGCYFTPWHCNFGEAIFEWDHRIQDHKSVFSDSRIRFSPGISEKYTSFFNILLFLSYSLYLMHAFSSFASLESLLQIRIKLHLQSLSLSFPWNASTECNRLTKDRPWWSHEVTRRERMLCCIFMGPFLCNLRIPVSVCLINSCNFWN